MKRKLMLICLLASNAILMAIDFPKEYKRESEEKKICKMVNKKVREEEWCSDYDICWMKPIYEEVEECHTETEWNDIWTGKYNTSGADAKFKEVAKDRATKAIEHAKPTTAERVRAKREGKDIEKIIEERGEKIGDIIYDELNKYGKNTGNDATNNKILEKEIVTEAAKRAIRENNEKYTDEELLKEEHAFASSKYGRSIAEKAYGLDRDVEYVNTGKHVDGTKPPIVLEAGARPSKEDLESGRPIYRKPERKEENDDDNDHHYTIPEPTYYNISFNTNGADSGVVPRTLSIKEGRYFVIPDNSGNLVKTGYKFIGWNTNPLGTGTTYIVGKSYISRQTLNLYAKWEKVKEVVLEQPSDNVENNEYTIRFISNEYSKLEGNDTITVRENNPIGDNIPNVIVDKGYVFKEFVDNEGNRYSIDQLKSKVPTKNTNFLVVTEKDNTPPKVTVPIGTLIPATPIPTNDEITSDDTTHNTPIPRPEITYVPLEVYVGDKVNASDVVDRDGLERFLILWEEKPDTSNPGITTGKVYLIDSINKGLFDGYSSTNIRVLPIPTLTYKDNRTKPINTPITPEDVVANKLDDRYIVEITNEIDTNTIGTKTVNLRITDTLTGRSWNNYSTDIALTEELDPIDYIEDPDAYVGDSIKVGDIIDENNFPNKYRAEITNTVDTNSDGDKEVKIIITNPTSGSRWTVTKTIKILQKPQLEYKAERKKEINNPILVEDVVKRLIIPNNPTIDTSRYEIVITNTIDITTIGTKDVELKIIDRKHNREFAPYNTDILLEETLKDLPYIEDNNIYVGDKVTVDDVINRLDIPAEYKIEILTQPDTSTAGDDKSFKIVITNPTSGSRWEIDRTIDVINEPNLVANGLWIYQNDKNPTKKGNDFIPNINVDGNERFPNRYIIKLIDTGDISKIGETEFTYEITDLEKNRKFNKKVKVEVREENINPKLSNDKEYNVGDMPRITDLVTNIDLDNYETILVNYNDFDELRKTPGEKIAKVRIVSKITGKVWNYDVPVIYKEVIVDLGELIWEKGEKLTLEEIRRIKNIPADKRLVLRSPKQLRYDKIEEYDAVILIYNPDDVYVVGNLRINIVDNTTINDLDKIDKTNKIHLINGIDNVSDRLSKKLANKDLNKNTNFWVEQSNASYRYVLRGNTNLFGGKIGYDKAFNDKYIVGAYFGYDRMIFNLTGRSTENMVHTGAYIGSKKEYNKNNTLIGGIVGQYTYMNGDLNFINKTKDKINYSMNGHNILLNIFVGNIYKVDNNVKASMIIGNTLLYNFNNNITNSKQSIFLKNNIANEVYTQIGLTKVTDKHEVFGGIKLSYLYGKTQYTLNDINFDKSLNKYNVGLNLGYNYKFNDNNKLGFETFYKLNDTMFTSRYGIRLNFEHKFDK